jgi:hypothetical protein
VTSAIPSAVRRVPQEPEPFFPEPLKAVRRASRLEGAAPEDLGARPTDRRRGRPHLPFVLRRARAGHDDHFIAADPEIADRDHGAFRLEGPARQLVGLGDAHHFVDPLEHFDQTFVGMPLPDRAEHRSRDAGRPVHVHPHLDEPGHDILDLCLRRPLLHHHNHDRTPLLDS